MADKLVKFYSEAQQLGGLKAQMRLAVITRMPSSKAANESDSPDNIEKFEAAMMEIKKEFS